MASIQQLLRRSQQDRTQVAGPLSNAPKLQAVINSGGRYTVQTQQAGKNKWQMLAETLSTVNPMLREYSTALHTRDQQLMKEGFIDYQTDSKKMELELAEHKKQQNKTKNGIRKLIGQGLLPDEANGVRMLGALKAKANVLINRNYRHELMSADSITNTVDPEVRLAEARKTFLERGEFQSSIVKEHALEHMQKVENEFRNTIVGRQQKAEIEEGKVNWLRSGEDLIGQVINGSVDINHPEIFDWVNHEASLFPGANKFAFDNLIKKELVEGLTTVVENPDGSETTKYTPDQALEFLYKLRDWKTGESSTFADAETGAAINNTIMWLNDRKSSIANAASDAQKKHYDAVVGAAVDLFVQEAKDGARISQDTFNSTWENVRGKLPQHLWEDAVTTLRTQYSGLNKKDADIDTDLQNDTYAWLAFEVDEGLDLESTKKILGVEQGKGNLSTTAYISLIKRLEESRNFQTKVESRDAFKDLDRDVYQYLTGIRKGVLGGGSGLAAYGKEQTKTWWNTIKLPEFTDETDDVGNPLRKDLQEHLIDKMGRVQYNYFAHTQSQRYTLFFKGMAKARFAKIESDPNTTPEQAVAKLENELITIKDEALESWKADTFNFIRENLGITFNTYTPTE